MRMQCLFWDKTRQDKSLLNPLSLTLSRYKSEQWRSWTGHDKASRRSCAELRLVLALVLVVVPPLCNLFQSSKSSVGHLENKLGIKEFIQLTTLLEKKRKNWGRNWRSKEREEKSLNFHSFPCILLRGLSSEREGKPTARIAESLMCTKSKPPIPPPPLSPGTEGFLFKRRRITS